ncbi:tRNA-queuosine alpha-mannosyltransferase domain-containing protein [Caldilinea sp.]|uniref:tRNA-queuosine alpha-mannosyltransferase domain-containing protein n=1 Tax=Caldilinea sp. TaxID=2293560 RepID=UPI0021DCDA4E|nr:DUF3524 domain-containing protein [Caldilinea sp.]GIV71131.1 MAG: glycosyl transferase family 1 [Caldilinea sp.]
MNIWLISPYHAGSHRAWAEGYARCSRHTVSLLTMSGSFWKWRMQGGAIELTLQAQRLLEAGPPPDVILATDMLNLPAWLGLMRRSLPASIPVALYMHENQLTYPWRPGEGRDLSFAMINWLSQLVADVVFFNSRYHLDAWFGELPNLLKHFPDYNHLEQIEEVRARSEVLPVGVEAHAIAKAAGCRLNIGQRGEREHSTEAVASPTHAPLILWNQRWEYDKRPDRFFALLYRLRAAGVPFRLAVAGENFRQSPQEFAEAAERLADVIVHWGYVESREAYWALLAASDLVISTAEHEFFGVSVLEAIAAGAFPLLPNRLSYPELIPAELHPACLYNDEEDLFMKAATRLRSPRPAPPSLRRSVLQRFDWPRVAAAYDERLEALARK